MSKLRCRCGYIIRDQTDFIPYKAMFIPDEDDEACFVGMSDQILDYIKAREQNQQEAFIHKHFGPEATGEDFDEEFIVYTLVSYPHRFGCHMYECENCGRIWIHKHEEYGNSILVSYVPEENVRGVLKSQINSRSDTDNHEVG